MGYSVPTLSSSGWETGVRQKADRLMSYFLVSQKSQSEIYFGKVKSLPYLIQAFGAEIALTNEVKNAIISLYSGHFDAVEASAELAPVSEDSPIQRLTLNVIVTENSNRYSLGRIITYDNKILNIQTEDPVV